MQHVRCCPTPERLVASHAAAANDWRDSGMLRHQQLARTANKCMIDAGAVKKAGERLEVRLIATGGKTVSDGQDSQWCGAACGEQCKKEHGSDAAHLYSGNSCLNASERAGFKPVFPVSFFYLDGKRILRKASTRCRLAERADWEVREGLCECKAMRHLVAACKSGNANRSKCGRGGVSATT